jgi:hypothetical protein
MPSDLLPPPYALLIDVILPNLKAIQANQAEQRLQSEELFNSLQDFRAEMRLRFSELRAELALCRQEVEDVMVTLRDNDSIDDSETRYILGKSQIH